MDVLKIGVCAVALTAGLAVARPCLAQAETPAVETDAVVPDEPMPPDALPDTPSEPAAVEAPSAPAAPKHPAGRIWVKADKVVYDATGAKAGRTRLMMRTGTDKDHRSVVRIEYAPDAPPAPPAAVAAPPAPPVHARHTVRIMRFDTPEGVKEMKWENDVDDAMAKVAPEFDKAIADAHKNMADMHKRVIVIDRRKLDKITAEAVKAQVAMNKAEMRKMMAQAQAERVRALEQSRAEIERELADARQAEAEARRDAEADK